jgi:CBS domain-containing protein
MHDRDVTHIPVIDDDRKVVGIIARGDLVRDIARTT